MKSLLVVTAAIEVGAGLVLMACPSLAVELLLGSPLDALAAVALGAWRGLLLALGVACWLAQYDAQSRAAKGLVGAMVLYNVVAVVVLSCAGVPWRAVGIALWPAVALHAAMTAWCIACLWRKPTATV